MSEVEKHIAYVFERLAKYQASLPQEKKEAPKKATTTSAAKKGD